MTKPSVRRRRSWGYVNIPSAMQYKDAHFETGNIRSLPLRRVSRSCSIVVFSVVFSVVSSRCQFALEI